MSQTGRQHSNTHLGFMEEQRMQLRNQHHQHLFSARRKQMREHHQVNQYISMALEGTNCKSLAELVDECSEGRLSVNIVQRVIQENEEAIYHWLKEQIEPLRRMQLLINATSIDSRMLDASKVLQLVEATMTSTGDPRVHTHALWVASNMLLTNTYQQPAYHWVKQSKAVSTAIRLTTLFPETTPTACWFFLALSKHPSFGQDYEEHMLPMLQIDCALLVRQRDEDVIGECYQLLTRLTTQQPALAHLFGFEQIGVMVYHLEHLTKNDRTKTEILCIVNSGGGGQEILRSFIQADGLRVLLNYLEQSTINNGSLVSIRLALGIVKKCLQHQSTEVMSLLTSITFISSTLAMQDQDQLRLTTNGPYLSNIVLDIYTVLIGRYGREFAVYLAQVLPVALLEGRIKENRDNSEVETIKQLFQTINTAEIDSSSHS